jgi:ubiquinone/menaquinone biosynthesis C-methylase UbiE
VDPRVSSFTEEQNTEFDREFHTQEELKCKFSLLCRESGPFKVLDLGGGNGLFADQLLARFPKSSVTILDISSLLLAKNKPSYRKELIHGSIECMANILVGRRFDYITMNWVLHHLVGNSYTACRKNCLETLMRCKLLLEPNGMLVVAENMFDGYMGSNLPSRLIYTLTAIRWPWFVRLTKHFFNTAGVGVYFQSRWAWHQMFAEAGYDVIVFQQGLLWWWLVHSLRGLMFHLLFIKSVSQGHFFLKPKNGQSIMTPNRHSTEAE